MELRRLTLLLGAFAALAGTPARAAPDRTPDRLFRHVADGSLGEAAGRIDYQSLDPAAQRLYVAGMGAGKLLVYDVARNRLAGERDGFPKVTGVLVVPELGRLYASVPGAGLQASVFVGLGMVGLSPGRGAVAVLDTADMAELTRLPGGVFPDGLAYAPDERRVFVSDELGSAVLVINAVANRPAARIALGGEAGNVRYDPRTARIYVPLQTRDELAVIDPASATLLRRDPLPGCSHPHGLAIAPGGAVGATPGRAIGYVACDGNDRLVTIELATGAVLGVQPVADDPDVLAVDPGLRRLYVASESGTLSTFDLADPAAPVSLGDVFVAPGAHSVAVDPATHRLYLPLADRRGQAVMRVLEPRP